MLARFRARGDARGRAACAGRGPQGMLPLRAFLRIGVVPCVAGPRHGSRARPQGALRAVTLAESICVLGTLMPSKMRDSLRICGRF